MVKEVDPKDKQAAVPALNPEIVRESGGEVMPQRPQEIEDWRTEFPYPWDEDEVVTRRDTLRFLLGGSGALFLATGVLAIIGNLPSGPGVKAVPIAKVGELAENQWKVFDFPDQYAQGILINLPGKGLVAYSDVCTHLSCAVVYEGNGKLHCPCHEGLFDATTGNVLAGPPTRPLPLIQIAIHGDTIYAVKEVLR
ncbi:MAG TPA: ubiquinol-cytochrome c reductase iron-sulfur subunit [Ktedonobacteraceae bacterium]|jgi:Rieske Fe-S protein|nr:ubiquinol-cytochrome c reductase iron-sulfur subunit [Ktedonobacteraceae bacterium]